MEIKVAVIPTGIIMQNYCGALGLTENEQRELLTWFKNNKPELLREICCENCDELADYHNYCENHIERLK
jgi:hypothetical protein